MDLDEYLKAIEQCPDKYQRIDPDNDGGRELYELTIRYGVYDNYCIALAADCKTVHKELIDSGRFEESPELPPGYLKHKTPAGVRVQVRSSSFTTTPNEKKYPTSVTLHIPEEEIPESMNWIRLYALAIKDIGEIVKEKRIPSWFVSSQGWGEDLDINKTVVFNPS